MPTLPSFAEAAAFAGGVLQHNLAGRSPRSASSPNTNNPRRSQTTDSYFGSSNDMSFPQMSARPAGGAGGGRYNEARRAFLRKLGEETLDVLSRGSYSFRGVDHALKLLIRESNSNTKFYPSNEPKVMGWASSQRPRRLSDQSSTHISILNISTIDAARLLHNMYHNNPGEENSITGVLNFASATKPGGGFKNGAEAQEESIARASTLYPALTTEEASHFYNLHKQESAQNNAAYYSHAMIYTPRVIVFRDDDGLWTYPFEIDVLTCAAVNAGEVLKNTTAGATPSVIVGIEKEMTERMGRILFLFEKKGIRNIILGTFGTGVFRNDIGMITRIWAQLLIVPTARFKDSFDRVIFAVTGETTFVDFKTGFEAWGEQRAVAKGLPSQNEHNGQNGHSNPGRTSILSRLRP
ncbi:hypothetical protein CPB83DRAFT_858605 [Crepidotus variabilis]|uniref:Microbial-type PARG catalytic domain-containing protein n=1 Tax=Crepidotus variabilis TaxID=179855 RepID=A0A9P6EBW6_9AGAR|nr:hypothetical protein CPB83DRAFT_858605 [Crepidotus variabilis]